MCGRYSLALRPAQVRQMLEADDMPVDEAPAEDEDGDGPGAPRQSYNFAPGYHGIVYRADVPDWGAGPRRRAQHGKASTTAAAADDEDGGNGKATEGAEDVDAEASVAEKPVSYKLQSMKWGLVPFWTKRNPDYGSVMKTINCRDDSLAQAGGMWSSMKARKRCVAVAQGFYEWLKKDGGREKMPHFVKRRDGKLMCFAGLWDVVQYENDDQKHYTYTIITTDSNKQLSFLHDRMPVILENGSAGLRTWLDPGRHEWSKELQALLRPFEGELDVYPVSKDVGKVGNNSPSFIIPIDSKENKSNIANFFANAKGSNAKKMEGTAVKKEKEEKEEPCSSVKQEKLQQQQQPEVKIKKEEGFIAEDAPGAKDDTQEESKAFSTGIKREADDELVLGGEPPRKTRSATASSKKAPSPQKGGARPKISATSNGTKSPGKAKQQPGGGAGSQKITKFFANSS
ncbi:DUF159-domain-containing protein [Whalleya microplaca]|nr:DUF159-domain-containing protein [Whalleya microplaca]